MTVNLMKIVSNTWGIVFCFLIAETCCAQTPVAAKVGEDSISVGEVRRELMVALGEKELTTTERQVLEAQTLGLLVNRQLVVRYMQTNTLGASEADIEQSFQEMTNQLKAKQSTLADYLKTLGITETELRRTLFWEIGWPKYLSRKLTPENITKYFEANKHHFDGTKLEVSHILWKTEPNVKNSVVLELAQQAAKIRESIVAKQMTFADAAKQHSQAATAQQGGSLGAIERHKPMPASFNDAAFELKPGDISQPVITTFGVHLIQCNKQIPGTLTLRDADVEKAVREELIRYLFDVMASRQRAQCKIEFTGTLPYLKHGTSELVLPTEERK
jgi:parvulin-like peptidyl-prolyl isomerase